MTHASLYVMQSTCGFTKVGYSRDPERRRRDFQRDRGLELRLVRKWPSTDGAQKIEFLAHRRLGHAHVTGELFSASADDCVAAVEEAIRVHASGEMPAWAGSKLKTRNAGCNGAMSVKTIRFGAALEAAINEQIEARLDAPDFGGMVRELVAEAIEARKGKRK